MDAPVQVVDHADAAQAVERDPHGRANILRGGRLFCEKSIGKYAAHGGLRAHATRQACALQGLGAVRCLSQSRDQRNEAVQEM